MAIPTHYLLNVALHALLISAAAGVALIFVRKAAQRGAFALAALISIGVLPWVSPLLPGEEAEDAPGAPQISSMMLPATRVLIIPAGDLALSPSSVESTASSARSLPSASTLALAVWLGGSVLALAAVAACLVRLARWRASLRIPKLSEIQVLADALPSGLAMEDIRLSAAACSPCVSGFIRPLLVLPDHLLDTCSARELAWILRHEQGHLKGQDSRWTLLLTMVRAVFWWNPLLHHFARQWAAAREELCDLHAEENDRASYSNFLLRMASACTGSPALVAPMAGGAKRRLRKRIVSLLDASAATNACAGRTFVIGTSMALLVLGLCTSCVRIGDEGGQGGSSQVAGDAKQAPFPSSEPGEKVGKGPILQVKVSNKVLSTPAPIAKNGAVLSPEELQEIMSEASKTKGNLLITFPSFATRNMEEANIEIIREKPPTPGEKQEVAGWQLQQTPRYDGKTLRFDSKVRYAFVPGRQFSPDSKLDFDKETIPSAAQWKKLVVKTGAAEAKVPEQHTIVTTLGEVVPGKYSTLFTTIEPIDPAGLPTRRYQDAVFTPRGTVAGKVRLNAALLKGEQMAGIDDVQDFDPASPATSIVGIFNRDQWQVVGKDVQGKPLAGAAIPTGRTLSPWKEVPELQLHASRYQGESAVSLDVSVAEPNNTKHVVFARHVLSLEAGNTVIYRLPAPGGKVPRYVALTVEEIQ